MIEEQRWLEVQLQEAESEHRGNGCKANRDKVSRTTTVLNTLLSQNAERSLCKQKHKVYGHADRSGRYLSSLISNKSSNKSITRSKDKNGKSYHGAAEMAKVFNDSYTSLYTSESSGMEDKMNAFFQCIKLPKASLEDRCKCDRDIISKEVEEVISILASGKIYEVFKGIFLPFKQECLNTPYQSRNFPNQCRWLLLI